MVITILITNLMGELLMNGVINPAAIEMPAMDLARPLYIKA